MARPIFEVHGRSNVSAHEHEHRPPRQHLREKKTADRGPSLERSSLREIVVERLSGRPRAHTPRSTSRKAPPQTHFEIATACTRAHLDNGHPSAQRHQPSEACLNTSCTRAQACFSAARRHAVGCRRTRVHCVSGNRREGTLHWQVPRANLTGARVRIGACGARARRMVGATASTGLAASVCTRCGRNHRTAASGPNEGAGGADSNYPSRHTHTHKSSVFSLPGGS